MNIIQGTIVSALLALAGPASAQGMDHTMLGPQDIEWAKAPASVPPGRDNGLAQADANGARSATCWMG
jgi:hypothetical protein